MYLLLLYFFFFALQRGFKLRLVLTLDSDFVGVAKVRPYTWTINVFQFHSCYCYPRMLKLTQTHLELSVNTSLLTQPTPFFRVINLSPFNNGLLPSLSRKILALNSPSVQSSLPLEPNSPLRAQISTFREERGPTLMWN